MADPLTAFASALNAEMTHAGLNQSELGTKANVSQGMISAWLLRKTANPEPSKVFAVEHALDLTPGHLSRHLGYIPIPPDDTAVVDLKSAIDAAPDLDDVDKGAIRGLYNVLRRRSRSAASNTVSADPARMARKSSSSASS